MWKHEAYLSIFKFLSDVGLESLDDDVELGFWLHRLEVAQRPRLRLQVHARVVVRMADDPGKVRSMPRRVLTNL